LNTIAFGPVTPIAITVQQYLVMDTLRQTREGGECAVVRTAI
jgi:hypothetical protein